MPDFHSTDSDSTDTPHVVLSVSEPLPAAGEEVEPGVRYAVPSFMPPPATWFLDALEKKGRINKFGQDGNGT